MLYGIINYIMNSLLLLFLLLIIYSQTYISYIIFLLCMIHIVLYIFLLGNYYLALIYLTIYIGSIAILFIYILMVLSIVSSSTYGYLLFLLPFITISIMILGIYFPYYSLIINNIFNISYSLYSTLLIPIGLILFIAMVFAIRSI
jgi:hypothetical protein